MSWLLAFVGFAVLIVLHEAGHFAAAKAVGMRVERFSLFFPPLVARWRPKRSETEYAVGAVPLGGYVKISGMNPNEEVPPEHAHRAYFRQPVWKRVVVIAAGPAVNFVLAFLILWVLFLGNGQVTGVTREIASVTPGSPAASVLEPGDVLVAVDGRRGPYPELARQLASHRCAVQPPTEGCRAAEPARLTVRRDGELRTFTVVPRYSEEAGKVLVGFVPVAEVEDLGVGGAAAESLDFMWYVTSETVQAIVRLVYSEEARDEVGGIVGAYEVTRQGFDEDVALALRILGIVSLSLAVINLFPFLPLDGGHIFWAVAEKLRGRAISFRTMERASVVGFMLVIFLFLIGFTNDLERIANDELRIR